MFSHLYSKTVPQLAGYLIIAVLTPGTFEIKPNAEIVFIKIIVGI